MDSSGLELKCSICHRKDKVNTFCLGCCNPLYCDDCLESHAHVGTSMGHCIIDISSGDIRNTDDENILKCSGCDKRSLVSTATHLCPVCCELFCQKCILIHSNSKLSKQHQVTTLSSGILRTPTSATPKMADKTLQKSVDDGQLASELDGTLNMSGATNIDICVAQAPLSVLSSGAVTEDKVAGVGNTATQSVTNMTYVGDFNIKLHSDQDKCVITGIACLSDGLVVISDGDNKKVKVYNTDCNYLYFVQYTGRLWGITVVSSDTVVVIENTKLRYLQLDTQGGIMLDKSINIPHHARAVSYAADTFAIMCLFPPEVVIINDSGVKLTVVKLNQVKGDPALATLLDKSGTRFYICDYYNHRVLCYCYQSEHTGVLWECSVSPNPHSVVHIGDSLVVVCKKKVHVINKLGHHIQEVVVHGINFDNSDPLAAYQISCRKLVIATRRGNKFQVFQL